MSNEQWVLEWSKKQNCFHMQPLSQALAASQQSFVSNTSNDYKIIMVGTKEVIYRMADQWRHWIVTRSAQAA